MSKKPNDAPAPASPGASPFDPTNLQSESNFPLALLGGIVAAALGAGAWAAITLTTGYKLGLVAIGVGFLVGLAVGKLGKGTTPVYGVMGGLLAAAGCALGNVLSIVGFAAGEQAVPFMSVLSQLSPQVIVSVVVESFSPMDGLFYAIAIYEGFKLSFAKPAAAG